MKVIWLGGTLQTSTAPHSTFVYGQWTVVVVMVGCYLPNVVTWHVELEHLWLYMVSVHKW